MNKDCIIHGVQMDRNINRPHNQKNSLYLIRVELIIFSTVPEDTTPYKVENDLNRSLHEVQQITKVLIVHDEVTS
jgi:hypothetical protein